ncbi:rho GTPase-activating protein conundrum [Phlebotomus argentipes]|uniref:rho GTPase-activating protein conundrum n=1 Tax=Phlebotomus argentipes TaxID=94469 RepID=UPI00289300B7|nr:rho GTPase-activating protein conundrum [Phlebotomus argentipes]
MLDPDLDEYLSEYRLQTPVEPISHYADGELEAQWLMAAGFPHLTRAFEEGRELPTSALTAALSGLSQSHAEAVKQRVKALNRTVRGRTRSRHQRKPDIRDVFRDVDTSSTGTRSRSATPDSLDSIPGDEHWNTNQQVPSFVSIFDGGATLPTLPRSKQHLRRTPSAPLRGSAELFRGSHVRCDIPFFTEGIELVGFQRLGTIHIPRVRSGSDPSCSVGRRNGSNILTGRLYGERNEDSSQSSSPLESPTNSPPRSSPLESAAEEDSPSSRRSPEPVSFEGLCRQSASTGSSIWIRREPCCDVDDLCESDLKKIQPLLWLELAALFDRHHIVLDKRKPFKRKKKEEGNVFGVSLNALVRRDQQTTGEDTSLVPLLLQGILKELVSRGAKEEGILRVAGNKQKIELVYADLEQNFYSKPEKVEPLLRRCGVHDLSAILKRWLRELPQPLLANDLIHLFYQTQAIPPEDQGKALSVLCLLLPHENRNTLRALLDFLRTVVALQSINKMSNHNVATIIAPSLFPPRFVHPGDKNDIGAQVRMAAQCCHLTDILISQEESLWMVPQRLLDEARSMNKPRLTKRQARKTKSESSAEIRLNHNPSHIHRLVV